MGKLRVYCLKTLNKLSIYPLGNAPSAPSVPHVVMNNTTMECGTLIGIQTMVSELVTGHLTNCVTEVRVVQILEPVLIRVMSVGATVKVHG